MAGTDMSLLFQEEVDNVISCLDYWKNKTKDAGLISEEEPMLYATDMAVHFLEQLKKNNQRDEEHEVITIDGKETEIISMGILGGDFYMLYPLDDYYCLVVIDAVPESLERAAVEAFLEEEVNNGNSFAGSKEEVREELIKLKKLKMKKVLCNKLEELSKLPKPDVYKYGGTFYGSAELFTHVGNHLEIQDGISYTVHDYCGATRYNDAVLLKVGSAYRNTSLGAVEQQLVEIMGNHYDNESRTGIFYKYGTNFSVVGFGTIVY